MERSIEDSFAAIAANFIALKAEAPAIAKAAGFLIAAVRSGGRIFLCGNGGSAADAQHLAAELIGRFNRERAPIAALALTTDSSALTAIANDYAFEEVFARQLRGLGHKGDVLIAISTSGKSPNVLKAAEVAREKGLVVIALTGTRMNPLASLAHLAIQVPASDTARIQEMHIAVGHVLCSLIEDSLA